HLQFSRSKFRQRHRARGEQSARPLRRDRSRPAVADIRARGSRLPRRTAVWGWRTAMGRLMPYTLWRALAWPFGSILLAAGLGVMPTVVSLPAGAGGLIGLGWAQLSQVIAHSFGMNWLAYVLPLLLLAAGAFLSFLATGLEFLPLARG